MTTTENSILELLVKNRPEVDFSNSIDFIQDGLLDSFDIVMLTTELEKTFCISIPGEEILPEAFASVSSIKSLIDRLQIKG
jgi:acyl carrier protein